jgi:Flp pilus assembly protein TadD
MNSLHKYKLLTWKNCFTVLAVIIGFTMLHISKDFGITLDEDIHNDQGKNIYAYFQHKSNLATRDPFDTAGNLNFQYGPNFEDLTGSLNIFGGFFDLVCVTTYNWFHFTDGEYENRHLINAFFGFIGLLFAGLLAAKIGGWRAGVLTLLFMALSPRYIGHSMNNPKDIPFAAFYTLNCFLIIKLLDELPRPKIMTIVWLVICIALGIDIRVSGLLIIAYLGIFYGGDIFWKYLTYQLEKSQTKTFIRNGAILIVICLFGYLGASFLWPYDKSNPFKVPLLALSKMSHFDVFNSYDLFEGRWWNRDEIPWYYVPKWFYITMPLFMLIGLIISPLLIIRIPKISPLKGIYWKRILAVVFFFVFPIIYVIIVKANVYNDGRHLLFCYPPMVVLCALSIENVFKFNLQKYIKIIIAVIIAYLMFEPLHWMIKNHPNEVTYFSPVVGGIDGAFKKYETDYWGNSDRAAIEWIQDNVRPTSPDKPIRIRKWYGTKNSVDYYIRKKPGYVYVSTLEESEDWDYEIIETVSCKWFKNVLFNWPPPGTVHQIMADSTPLLAIVKNYRIGHPEIILFETEKQVEANPTAGGYYSLGLIYYQNGRYIESIEANRKAIAIKPDYAEAYNNIAAAYGAMFMWQEEIDASNQALKINPDFGLARNNLNLALSMLKSPKTNATAIDYINQSLQYFREAKYEECISACNKAIKLDPTSATAYNNICSSYNALGKYKEAEKACEKALELQPNFDLARNNLNLAKSKLKR